MKLFNRNKETINYVDGYKILDELMSKMASTETYIEYLRLREMV